MARVRGLRDLAKRTARQTFAPATCERMNVALAMWSSRYPQAECVQAEEPIEPAAAPIAGDAIPDNAIPVDRIPNGVIPDDVTPDAVDLQGEEEPAVRTAWEPPAAEDASAEPQPAYIGDSAGPRGEPEPEREETYGRPQEVEQTDYYEILQISRNADMETIHRVYRMMACRFHPDNPESGDTERFLLLRRAYHVLSDASRRMEYDAALLSRDAEPLPVFQLKDFVNGLEGEMNRRLGVLSLLYHRRRMNENRPGISVLELEKRMDFPREHLNFTLWYLRAKRYIRIEENSDYSLTVEGADYVETNSSSNRIIRDLLTSGPGLSSADPASEVDSSGACAAA